jgi:phosphate/sulfate permease
LAWLLIRPCLPTLTHTPAPHPTNTTPGGIGPIVASWFISPLLAALITLFFFLVIRSLVLRRPNSTKLAFWMLPALLFITVFVSLIFVLVSEW